MSKHTIPLLEFVTAQPAHKLPVVFTNEKCPLPDCTESPEEIFKEVLTLQRQGWIEARINRDVIGKPSQVEIRYVTLEGSAFLHGRQADSQEGMPIGKLIIWGSGGITILISSVCAHRSTVNYHDMSFRCRCQHQLRLHLQLLLL